MSSAYRVGGGTDKFNHNQRSRSRLLSAAAMAVLGSGGFLAHPAHAGSGTWTNTAGGTWSTTTNWASGNVASGATFTADFSTVVPSAANTVVNLDAPYTVGLLNLNSTTTADSWNLSNNSNAANILTFNNGSSQPVVTVATNGENSTISASIAGTNGFIKTGAGALTLSGSNTYSGVTTLNSTTSSAGADLYLLNNNSLGTSTLYIDPGTANNTRVYVGSLTSPGVVIPNNITINTSRALLGANGALMTSGIYSAGFSGTITINNPAASGGHICGPVDNTLTNFLTFSGPINLSPAYYSNSGNYGGPTATGKGVLDRAGNLILAGGGSYYRFEERCGDVKLGANNGIATNSYFDMGINANGNPQAFATVDLNGFNQTMVGFSNVNTQAGNFPDTITNTSTTPVTLTLTPLPSSNISAGLVFSNSAAPSVISDNSANGGTLSLVINGDPTGIQTLNTPNSSYQGSTTLTSGTLSINTLANGGSNSCIGASSNAASNLVFNGGRLNYSGGSTSTDRSFTISTGTNALISVTTLASTLTMTGGGIGGGGFTKLGSGVLALAGTNAYTGPTAVSAGTLLVNGSLNSASNVSIASGATLGGTGTVAGAVTPSAGGMIGPAGVGAVGTLTVGALTLNTGSIVDFEFNSGGSSNDEVTVANSGGLTINGASIYLYNVGTTSTFSTVGGPYPLFNVTGSVGGSISNLSIADPAAGKVYNLTNTGGVIGLTIGTATTIVWNDNAGTNTWSAGGNWVGGVVPNSFGVTAQFDTTYTGSNGAVNLSAAETVGGLVFNNSGLSYALGGTGSLILNNGVAAAAVDILNGQHAVNVPISLSSATALDTTNTTDVLTIGGNITGAKSVAVNGPGTVTLTGTNSFTTVSVNASTLDVGSGTTGTLGTGTVTLVAAATLNFNTNTTYNFGQSITGSSTGESVNQIGTGNVTVGAISSVAAVNVSGGSLTASGIASGAINVTGSGSLTASGAVTGTAKLTVNTSGAVSLGASNAYTGGTEVDAGTLTLNAAGALPANSALAVNGGTLDLHGNSISISNILDTTTGGVITNSVASTTATIAFSGKNANYNMSAAINDGPSGGKVALSVFIDNTASSQDGVGNEYALILNSAGTYSGGTTVSKQSIQADATNAFGTGPITFLLNNSSTNNSRLDIVGGVTLPNNITFAQGNPYSGFGDIQYITTTSGSATLTGSVTVDADQFSGGTFSGPTNGTDVLNVNGPVYTAGTATTISVRSGSVAFGGGGSYPNLQIFSNVTLNAANGIATNAAVNFPQGAPTLDLSGFNQSIAGLSVTTGTGLVTNSSATPATLTVSNATASNYAGGTITGNLSLVKGGVGTLLLTGNNTYTGSTTIGGGRIQLGALPQPSLVASYSFDNTTNTPVGTPTTIANAGTGGAAMNGNVNQAGGTNNVTITAGGPGNFNGGTGNSLSFNGTGSVDIPSPITDLSGTGSWTLSTWLETSQSGSTILSKNSGGWAPGNSVFYLGNGASGGGTEPSAVRNSGGFETGTGAVSDGNWHMVTYVDNAGTITIYIDGVATAASQTGFTTADVGTQVQLGFTSDTVAGDGTLNMVGNLDDINVFSGALSAGQVTNLYTSNAAGALTPSYVLPSTTALNLNTSGGSLDLDGNIQAVASLTGVAGTQVILGGGTLIVGDATPTTTFAGSITDAGSASNASGGSLFKQGTGNLTLSGVNSYTGSTTVSAGTLTLAAVGALPAGTNLNINASAKMIASNLGSPTALAVGTLSIGVAGQLDLNNNALVVESSNLAAVNALVKSGYSGGAWNGATGIISSTAASNLKHLTALGVIQDSATGSTSGTPLYTSLDGQSGLIAGDVLVKYTYYGDTNLDGKVDGTDYSRIDNGALNHLTGWFNGDFNYDGVINGSDYTLIDNAFNTQGAQLASELASPTAQIAGAAGIGSSAVPEPATLGLLGIGAIGLLSRRSRARRRA